MGRGAVNPVGLRPPPARADSAHPMLAALLLAPLLLAAPEPELAEQLLAGMTLEEKAGQLVIAYPPGGEGAIDLGGVILIGKILRDPEAMRARIEELQRRSRIPLFVAVDLEGGDLNRLRSVPTLGALPPGRELGSEGAWEAEAWGRRAGIDMKALGINTSLGPVFDLAGAGFMHDTKRALGADPTRVARLGKAFARGLASAGVLAIGKHYPGYGEEAGSSDKALLIVDRAPQEIARQQAAFVAAGEALGGVMLANVGFRAYGGVPAILAPEIVARAHLSGWLTMTDDLAVPSLLLATGGDPRELVRRAFLAGNDLLLTTAPVSWDRGVDPRAVVVDLVRSDPKLASRLDESVLRILRAKVRHGLLREGVASR